ncbi:hypothetical protein HXX76_014126 [Chlamydomonas incerta]|uniref:Uncharacterized protein n=1 Tax=Chlamydomonas incerta TaxID=51695 RepID=A0A835SK55_CHLIN|nr:hypothetical protein HXX76_014126 [Chlamydomonas incerta]|eukprot:KAG2424968.1 hypothetical protein HXX76_014126 [Chlamydomonas incerta]
MYTLTQQNIATVRKYGGILGDFEPDEIGDELAINLPPNCTTSNMDDMFLLLEQGKLTPPLLFGACKNEVKFLGLEKAFENDTSFNSSTWKFLLAISESPSIMLQHLDDRYARHTTWTDWELASKQELSPFNEASLDSTPVTEIPASCHLIKGRPLEDRLDWEFLSQTLGQLPPDMPWAKYPGQAGIVLAGGCLESPLFRRGPKDYDLFIVLPGDQQPTEEQHTAQARTIILDTINAIRKHHSEEKVYISKCKPHVIDVIAFSEEEETRAHYQIITRVYASLAQVVAGFDIDSCRLGYDGSVVRAHPTAFRAWKNKWNLYNATTLSTTALIRYYKKFDAGIGILVPGVDKEHIDGITDKLVQRSKEEISEYMLRSRLRYLEPTIDNLLLVFRVASIASLANLIYKKSDYGDGSEIPQAEFFEPCTRLWISNTEPHQILPQGPHLAPVLTSMGTSPEWPGDTLAGEDKSFCIRLSFCVMKDCGGGFTGAFNPKECEIYVRNPWIHSASS